MSELFYQIFLAIVQGIAEWFPISSSGHLVLVSRLLNYNASIPLIVALHLGSLLGGIVYFVKDIGKIAKDFFHLKFEEEHGRLGVLVIIATIPAAVIGILFRKFIETEVSNLWLLALGFFITSILLFISSSVNLKPRKEM